MKVGDWEKTFWEDEKGNRITIQDVLSALQDSPVVSLEVKPLTQISNVVIEQHRKENADLSFPIIAVEQEGEIQHVLDGHHRLQRAIDESRTHILAKVLVV
tara:strand:+ start:1470 stop:1772 length:303 start_codon:yes stop_codon:yes gene_type:complete